MPESPEVQALADELDEQLSGHVVGEVDVLEFRVVKTRDRPPASLGGDRVAGVDRRGKLLDVAFDSGEHLVVSLGRHGWVRWGGTIDAPDAGTPPALVALGFDDGRSLEFTDAGSWVSLGLFVVDEAADVPAVAKLGPDPAHPGFSRADFDRAFAGRRKQLKAVLQDQESLAGIGNGYSDEILHAARLSPIEQAAALSDEELDRLYSATVAVLQDAVAGQRGVPIDRLKEAKVAAMRVHGRTGEPCPGCDGTVQDFSFASTTAQYCPACQTGGVLLPLRPE